MTRGLTYRMGRIVLPATMMFVFCISALLLHPNAVAQTSPSYMDYVRRDLTWYTIESEHFLVHFHADSSGNGSGRTARVVAEIAEDVYEAITDLYDYKPDQKVSFILKDYEDYSNGAAYFLDNVIEIWAPALNTPFRGEHNWLRNVISHEFTHMVQVQKSLKGSRKLPFYYLQFIGYENVQRPDILYGYPDAIVSYPFPILNNPAWLAEGTAQYQREFMSYDTWDSHRDMMLRTRILAGEELSLSEMGGFYSQTSLGRESIYNAGFAFTQYLAGRFGEEGLRDISDALGQFTNFTFEAAAKDAFGLSGGELYDDWIAELRIEYATQTADIVANQVTGNLIQTEGFNNFFARHSPDGTKIAYISNKGEDYSTTSLYVQDLASGEISEFKMPHGSFYVSAYTCAFGHSLAYGVTGPIDWHPDGELIVYSRIRDTRSGHLYADLYTIDSKTGDETRLTRDARAYSPAWSPDGKQVAFLKSLDGTANLYMLDVESGAVRRLTDHEDGSQITEPAWNPDGRSIAYGYSRLTGRDIRIVDVASGTTSDLVVSDSDERSPAFDAAGKFLYFSSDRTGIYNLYRVELAEGGNDASGSRSWKQLTNELGGAFMPSPGPDGSIVYSTYLSTGYKIAELNIDAVETVGEAGEDGSYTPPSVFGKARKSTPAPTAGSQRPSGMSGQDWEIITADDDSIAAFPSSAYPNRRGQVSDEYVADGTNKNKTSAPHRYEDVFTSFSFMPVLRFDNYVARQRNRTEVRLKDRSRAETIWRNTKLGFYTSSREILGGLSMFGGLLIGPGSRSSASTGDYVSPTSLLKLERDLFLQFDYNRGLGLIPQRWSPQFTLSLLNVGRNVDNGLAIEEFPCTACFPDTTLTHLRYNLWEVDLAARSKLNRSMVIEIGYRYSPYRVTTESFYSKELKQTVAESSSKYYIGRAARLKVYFEQMKSYRDGDVVPIGMKVDVDLENEVGQLLESFELEDGFLKPVYDNSTFTRLTISGRYYLRLPGISGNRGAHGLGIRVRGSSVLGKQIDDFYDDYIGGMTGARGYPYYALGGNRTLWAQVSYTFPIVPRFGWQFLWLYVDKVYARVYADAALAWSGSSPDFGQTRKDVGAELRISLGSFYLFPTAFFVSSTYAIDEFNLTLDDGFLTPDGSDFVRYGGVWKWHLGILFGFDQF